MSGNSKTIKVALQIDDKGSVKVLKDVGSESEKTGKKGKDSFDKMDKSARGFSGGADKAMSSLMKLGAGVAGLYGLQTALGKITDMTKEYVEYAGVQEQAEADLAAVLKATGNAAGYNLDQLKAMAGGMQGVTTIGDEVTLSGMAILATFKQVRGDAFERSTKAAMDMSQVMKQDLKSSMTMIGKAVNDPIAGLSALSRVGVTFTEDQKEMIKVMQNSGDIMGAQSIILSELESEFGGAAEAAAKNFAGGLTQADNALGDVKEELGFVITKNQFFIELTHLATEEFARWGGQIADNREYLMSLAKDGVLTVVDSMGLAIETLRFFHNGWLGIKLVGNAAVHGLAIALDELNPMMRTLMKPLDAIFQGLVKIGAMDVNPFDSLEDGLETFRLSSGDVTASVLSDIAKTNEQYDTIKSAVMGWKEKIEQIPVAQQETDDVVRASIIETTNIIKKSNQSQVVDTEWLKKTKIKAIRDEEAARAKAWQDEIRLSNKQIAQEKKELQEAKRTAASILQAKRNMFRDLGTAGEKNYELQKKLIESQAKDYKETGVEIVLIEEWKTNELRKLSEQQIKDSDNFFAGFKLGLEETQRDFSTWAENGVHLSKTMSDSMVSEFSGVAVAGIKGGIGDMKDAFGKAMDNMLDKLIETAAQMVIEWAATKVIKWGTSAIDWLTAESGVWNMDPTQIGSMYPDSQGKPGTPTVIHDREMVVPPGTADQIREIMESNGISDFAGMSSALSQVQGTISDFGKGPLDSAIGNFGSSFASNMGMHAAGVAAMAAALNNQGYDVGFEDAVHATLDPAAIASAALGAVTTAVTTELGLRTSSWGTIGQWAGSAAGKSYLGPVGGLLGILGAAAGMGAGDALDARGLEGIRDVMEDTYGWWEGQRKFATFVDGMGDAGWDTEGMKGWGGFQGLGIGNPSSYGGGNMGRGGGGDSTGGGYGGGDMGGANDGSDNDNSGIGGWAKGGVIDKVYVPRGEDGWAPVQLSEGVVSRPGMKVLEQINKGQLPMGPDNAAVVAEIRQLRLELKHPRHPIVRASKETAANTGALVKR